MTSSRAHRRAARLGRSGAAQSRAVLDGELPPTTAEIARGRKLERSRASGAAASAASEVGTPAVRPRTSTGPTGAARDDPDGVPPAAPTPGRRTTATAASRSARAAAAARRSSSTAPVVRWSPSAPGRNDPTPSPAEGIISPSEPRPTVAPPDRTHPRPGRSLAARRPEAPERTSADAAPGGSQVRRPQPGLPGDVVVAETGARFPIQAQIEASDETHHLLAWVADGRVRRVTVRAEQVLDVVFSRDVEPSRPRLLPGAPVVVRRGGDDIEAALLRYVSPGAAEIETGARGGPPDVAFVAELRALRPPISGPRPLLPHERTRTSDGKPGTLAGSHPTIWSAHAPPAAPSGRSTPPASRSATAPPPRNGSTTGATRRKTPGDLFPVGTDVMVESSSGLRRGTVRRTIGGSDILVLFETADGPLTRTVRRSRVRAADD